MVTITVSIAIAVFVGKAVTITAVGATGAVEDKAYVLVFLLLIETIKFGNHRTLKKTDSRNKDGAIHIFIDDLSIDNVYVKLSTVIKSSYVRTHSMIILSPTFPVDVEVSYNKILSDIKKCFTQWIKLPKYLFIFRIIVIIAITIFIAVAIAVAVAVFVGMTVAITSACSACSVED